MASETLYIVMPAYNEEENIRNVVAEWYPLLEYGSEKSRMVISDGGSSDHTLKILYDLQKEYPHLEVIPKPGTDHGTKVLFLYHFAIDQGADWVFQTDSDGQTLPAEFHSFWEAREQYEAVIGVRSHRGDGEGRKFVETVLRILLMIVFGELVPDANAPFRLMRSSVLGKYLFLIPDNFSLPNAILTICLKKYREKVLFKDITFQPRQGGVNYMNWKRIFRIGRESIYNFYSIRSRMNDAERMGELK